MMGLWFAVMRIIRCGSETCGISGFPDDGSDVA